MPSLTAHSAPTLAKSPPFRFSQKYLDDSTDWYYYGYRYYSPDLGRWPSRDPIGEDGGLNLYAYVRNASMNEMELLGLASVSFEFVVGQPWAWSWSGRWAQPASSGTGGTYSSGNYAKSWVKIRTGNYSGGSCNTVRYPPDLPTRWQSPSGSIRVWLNGEKCDLGKKFRVPVRISIRADAVGPSGGATGSGSFLDSSAPSGWVTPLVVDAPGDGNPAFSAANKTVTVTIPSSGSIKIAEYVPTIGLIRAAPPGSSGAATGRVTVGTPSEVVP